MTKFDYDFNLIKTHYLLLLIFLAFIFLIFHFLWLFRKFSFLYKCRLYPFHRILGKIMLITIDNARKITAEMNHD